MSTERADGLPRLSFDDIDVVLRSELQATVERLGYFGELFQVAAALPGAVSCLMDYTKAVKAPLSDAGNEVLALSVCALLNADYERIQHERLSLKLGLTREWVAAAVGRSGANMTLLGPTETALRQLALAMVTRQGRDCSAEIVTVAHLLDATQTVAALLQITRFITIAHLCNALTLTLPVASIFDTTNPFVNTSV